MVTRAAAVDQDFREKLDPLRPELLAHCYRMLGSLHEAEDLVQETYLNAWRAYSRFEGRSSLRTWLYRIATNACLTALDSRGRRPLPVGLGEERSDPATPPMVREEVLWLEPFPETDAAVCSRESIRLALIAALQYLPPKQRAVLILRDVMQWRATEVADILGTTTTAVNSALQRARTQLSDVAPDRDAMTEPTESEQRALLDRYAKAFEDHDIPAIVALFTDDAIAEMPPFGDWYLGGEAIGRLAANWCPAAAPGDLRLIPITLNAQPGFASYLRGEDGRHHAFKLEALTLSSAGVTHSVAFFDPTLFPMFGLPERI
ncbi:sigma-70 family RNA polymerase sigma factor [Actinocrispum sp. NPDC049592]|uniref:sigma-70 family RNA polymerase sigma factor n=1 Tax=Actinocrispum sp. NPDC049592 TaxID=3154835 RepID=UPI0034353352